MHQHDHNDLKWLKSFFGKSLLEVYFQFWIWNDCRGGVMTCKAAHHQGGVLMMSIFMYGRCIGMYFCVSDSRSLDWWGSRAGESSPAVSLLGQRRPPQRGRLTCCHLSLPRHGSLWQQTPQTYTWGVESAAWLAQQSASLFSEMFFFFFLFLVGKFDLLEMCFYFSGSEVSRNITLLKVSFQSSLSAGLGGQPADHMEWLGPTPDHSLNLTSFSFLVFHSTAPLHLIIPLLFLRDFARSPQL